MGETQQGAPPATVRVATRGFGGGGRARREGSKQQDGRLVSHDTILTAGTIATDSCKSIPTARAAAHGEPTTGR